MGMEKQKQARIFNEIGEKNVPRSVSRVLREEHGIGRNKGDQLSKWKKILAKEEIERILDIVSDFSLDFYTKDVEPDYENIGV